MFFRNLFKSLQPKTANLTLPSEWTPNVRMDRIHLHWTASSYVASAMNRKHYHFLIDGGKTVVKGNRSISGNVPPLKSGVYAAHTYRANSYAIGIGICSMHGAKSNPLFTGDYPLTEGQWDKAVELIAALARKYNIPVTPQTILTHAEVTVNLGIRQRGKWDIAWLPFWNKRLSAKEVGAKLRREVAALV